MSDPRLKGHEVSHVLHFILLLCSLSLYVSGIVFSCVCVFSSHTPGRVHANFFSVSVCVRSPCIYMSL